MSVRVLSWVLYDSPTTGNDRLALIAIADEADDEGRNAFPSMETIALKARISKRTAIRAVERLELGGALLVKRPETRGRGRYNRYVVAMGRDPVALAGAVGWPAPTLDPAIAAEWCQDDTISAQGPGPSNGAEWCQPEPEMVTPGVTRPINPLDPRSSRSLPGDRARAAEANVARQQAALDATIAANEDRRRTEDTEPAGPPPPHIRELFARRKREAGVG